MDMDTIPQEKRLVVVEAPKDFQEEKERISLAKLCCIMLSIVFGFWFLVIVTFCIVIPRMLVFTPYSVHPISYGDLFSCRAKIKSIRSGNYPDGKAVVIYERELNSLFCDENRLNFVSDILVTMDKDVVHTVCTISPIKISYIRSMFSNDRSDENSFSSLRKFMEDLRIRIDLKAIVFADEEASLDFYFKDMTVGIQSFPIGLFSGAVKYFFPKYKALFALGGVREIFTEEGKMSFFPK